MNVLAKIEELVGEPGSLTLGDCGYVINEIRKLVKAERTASTSSEAHAMKDEYKQYKKKAKRLKGVAGRSPCGKCGAQWVQTSPGVQWLKHKEDCPNSFNMRKIG
jgi:hypothetical protein